MGGGRREGGVWTELKGGRKPQRKSMKRSRDDGGWCEGGRGEGGHGEGRSRRGKGGDRKGIGGQESEHPAPSRCPQRGLLNT